MSAPSAQCFMQSVNQCFPHLCLQPWHPPELQTDKHESYMTSPLGGLLSHSNLIGSPNKLSAPTQVNLLSPIPVCCSDQFHVALDTFTQAQLTPSCLCPHGAEGVGGNCSAPSPGSLGEVNMLAGREGRGSVPHSHIHPQVVVLRPHS